MKLAFFTSAVVCSLILLSISSDAIATTKGLNQIVTPDTQPQGQLSLSYQEQDPNIGNREELQAELGITNNFEVAFFEGTSPSSQIANIEYGLYNRGSWLLSTGFTGWTTTGVAPQPFLEAGYYHKALQLILGAQRASSQNTGPSESTVNVYGTQAIVGVAYSPSSHVKLQVDYQSQQSNFATAGFTYAISQNLSFNPAIYVSNTSAHKGYGYAVLTWTIAVFGGQPPVQPEAKVPPTPGTTTPK